MRIGVRVPGRRGRRPATDYDAAVTDPTDLIELIRTSVIGDDEAVAGPFGIRRVTYADYTASGRALSFIEDYLRDAVLPLYANTHTESSQALASRRAASAKRRAASSATPSAAPTTTP